MLEDMDATATTTPVEAARTIFAALREHDLDTIWDLGHPDVSDDFVAVGEYRGREAVRGFFSELFAAFPDFDVEIVHLVGDTEHAVVQWRAHGTFTGSPFQGVHATGRPVELRGCDVMHFEEGRLRRNTIYYDGLTFARQIGLLPRDGSAADKAMTVAFNAGVDVWGRVRQAARSQTSRAATH